MSRVRSLLHLAAASFLLSGQLVAAAPVSPPSIRIESVTFGGRNPFGPGTRLAVSMRGTGSGAATFHIFGVTTDIGMRELRTAGYQGLTTMYTGAYVVRPGDAVLNGALFAMLAVRGTEVMAASTQRITIDGRPPTITARHPKPGSRVANTRPNIAIELIDRETAVNPASIRLIVNGQNVTARASISETSVTYTPETPFQPGPVRVDLTVGDRAKNIVHTNWTFHVDAPNGLISSVTISPATTLTSDDLLTVVATGAPGGAAVFSIQGVRGDRPMKELQTPGIYFGTLAVRQLNPVYNAPLIVTLRKNGQTSAVPATAPVTILAGPPAPPTIALLSRSISLDDPNSVLLLSGTSRPGSRILGRVDYVAHWATLEGTGTLGEFIAVAESNGAWRISLDSLVPLPQARLIVTVIAIDPAGRRSPPATLELTSS